MTKRFVSCKTCNWADWNVKNPPCGDCKNFSMWAIGSQHKDPDPIPVKDSRPDIEKYQQYFDFEKGGSPNVEPRPTDQKC